MRSSCRVSGRRKSAIPAAKPGWASRSCRSRGTCRAIDVSTAGLEAGCSASARRSDWSIQVVASGGTRRSSTSTGVAGCCATASITNEYVALRDAFWLVVVHATDSGAVSPSPSRHEGDAGRDYAVWVDADSAVAGGALPAATTTAGSWSATLWVPSSPRFSDHRRFQHLVRGMIQRCARRPKKCSGCRR